MPSDEEPELIHTPASIRDAINKGKVPLSDQLFGLPRTCFQISKIIWYLF